MPARLRPTAPIAVDAVLVGDPGRALLLAQELLNEPKMSNHARGLWGYSGPTAEGRELTIQSTGMGGPSAAVVLADLAKLGVRRAVRVGTCAALDPALELGELLVVERARAEGGSAGSFGISAGDAVSPDSDLVDRLERQIGNEGRSVEVASFDAPGGQAKSARASAADMQTATVLARGRSLGIAAAAVLIVEKAVGGERIGDEDLDLAAKRAGRAAAAVLSA